MENLISAQAGPSRPSLTRALAHASAPPWQAVPACQHRPTPALTSLYPSRWPVGSTCRRHFSPHTRPCSLSVPHAPLVCPAARTLACSRWPMGPVCRTRPLPPPPEPPAHNQRVAVDSTPTTHAEAAPVRPSPPRPFSSCPVPHLLSSPLTRALAVLNSRLASRAHLGSFAAVRRGPSLVLWRSLSLCRARCLGELHLFASNMGHLPVCPQPLWFARSALTGVLPVQPKPRCHRPEGSLRPRHCSSAPESPLELSNPHPFPYFRGYCSVVRVIARRSKFAPPLSLSTAVYALWCLYAGVVPTAESAVSPQSRLSPFTVPQTLVVVVPSPPVKLRRGVGSHRREQANNPAWARH
jgi:hypothetical protein